MSKILVTGGAGFIGSHLSNRLYELGHNVTVVDNLSNGKKENLNTKIAFIKEDITGENFITLLRKIKPEIIYHLAAQSSIAKSLQNPKADIKINLLATQKLIEIASKIKVKKIIFSSSAAVYGEQSKLPISEEALKNPVSIYGLTKLSCEYLFKINYKLNKLSYACLRYSNVYGSGQDTFAEGGVVAVFIDKILNKTGAVIYGDGNQTRDFIHVSDVVEANIRALNPKVLGNYNISTGTKTSINSLYDLLLNITNSKNNNICKPHLFPEVKESSLNSQKFQSLTHWYPQINLEQGLRATYLFFKQNRNK